MGNGDSSNGGGSSGGGSSGSGLNDHCYQVGYEHGSQSTNPDPVGDGLAAAPCTITKEANAAYARGLYRCNGCIRRQQRRSKYP